MCYCTYGFEAQYATVDLEAIASHQRPYHNSTLNAHASRAGPIVLALFAIARVRPHDVVDM